MRVDNETVQMESEAKGETDMQEVKMGVYRRKSGRTRILVFSHQLNSERVFFRRRWNQKWANSFDVMSVHELSRNFEFESED